jgi:hypothetical protein
VGKRHACLEQAHRVRSLANVQAAVEELYNIREFERLLRNDQEGGFVWLAWANIPTQERAYVDRLVGDFCDGLWAPVQ